MVVTMIRPRLMTWNDMSITDHNRSALSVDVERIETAQRMANGTMRKYWVADKRAFSCSWDMLPSVTANTVDGFAGGEAMEDFYFANSGAFSLKLFHTSATPTGTYNVMFSDFSKTVVKRWAGYELWTVTVSMEEV